MLELLKEHEVWQEFFHYKTSHGLTDKRETAELSEYIDSRAYLDIAEKIAAGEYCFSCPVRKELNKLGSSKKRVVYTFSHEENMILKLIAYLLYGYDNCLCDNCYAFRREIGARRAFTDIAYNPEISELWCFKADISNYFNSIDVSLLEPMLRRVISDDEALLRLLLEILCDDRSVRDGEIIHECRGVMAGTPISPFLANIYLSEMDAYFMEKGVIYARYSDDIIIFDTEEKLHGYIGIYRDFVEKYRLRSNPDKEIIAAPGEAWSFLGFEYTNGAIDISRVTVEKLMGKIRRASRSLRRWMLRNNATPERALKAFNRKFNKKFYSPELGRELCWSRWFFPMINRTQSLHAIDLYMQECQRYLVTGKHNKTCYDKVPYEMLRECGYRPLVSEYYDNRYQFNKQQRLP